MGNCFRRCFGIVDRRKRYPRSKYTDEQDFSIEFESLIGEEPHRNEMTRLLTDRERQLLSTKQFGVLVHEQGRIDAELEAKLAQEEKEIEREEAAFYEAKQEAARVAKLNKDKENSSRNNSKAWVDNEEWEIAGDEDEFENFLASVKARSLATISQVKIGSADAQSSGNSNAHIEGESWTKSGFVDVEWGQEAGISPEMKVSARNTEDSWSKPTTSRSRLSSDQEWDPDFVSAENDDKIQILNT